MKSASDLPVERSIELCVVVEVDFPEILSRKEESSSREASAVTDNDQFRILHYFE